MISDKFCKGGMEFAAALLMAVVTAAEASTIQPARPRCSGFSFAHPGGDCVLWYARDGGRLLDLLIAPRATFAACYRAAAMRLDAGGAEVAFGTTGSAYVCEGGVWWSAPVGGMLESDLPPVTEMERCGSTSAVARKVLGR